MKTINILMDSFMRNLSVPVFLKGGALDQKVSKSALKYQISKALEQSRGLSDFKRVLKSRTENGDFSSGTKRALDEFNKALETTENEFYEGLKRLNYEKNEVRPDLPKADEVRPDSPSEPKTIGMSEPEEPINPRGNNLAELISNENLPKQGLKQTETQQRLVNESEMLNQEASAQPTHWHTEANENIPKESFKKDKTQQRLINEVDIKALNPEQRAVYEVLTGKKDKIILQGRDLNDLYTLEKGSRTQGANKILIKHAGLEKTGGVSNDELLNMIEVVRKGEINADSFTQHKNFIRYAYDLTENKLNLRLVVEERNDGKKIFDFYSNRNFKTKETSEVRADLPDADANLPKNEPSEPSFKNEPKTDEVSAKAEPDEPFGVNFSEFFRDGKGAVQKLLSEKQGQVKGAFFREDLEKESGNGNIDLVWGEITDGKTKKGYGLSKILEKHSADFEKFSGENLNEKIANGLDEIVKNGKLIADKNGIHTIWHKIGDDYYLVGLSKGWIGKGDNKWVITAYKKEHGEIPKEIKGNATNLSAYSDEFNPALTSADEPLINETLAQKNLKEPEAIEAEVIENEIKKPKKLKNQNAFMQLANKDKDLKNIKLDNLMQIYQSQADFYDIKHINELLQKWKKNKKNTKEIPFKTIKEGYILDDLLRVDEDITYAVVRKSDLKPSLTRSRTQFRAGHSNSTISNIKNSFNEREHFKESSNFDGIPTITKEGLVIAGNHRTTAIKGLSGDGLERYLKQAKKVYGEDIFKNLGYPESEAMIVRILKRNDDETIIRLSKLSNDGRLSAESEKLEALGAKYKTKLLGIENVKNLNTDKELLNYLGSRDINEAKRALLDYLMPDIQNALLKWERKSGGDLEFSKILNDNALNFLHLKQAINKNSILDKDTKNFFTLFKGAIENINNTNQYKNSDELYQTLAKYAQPTLNFEKDFIANHKDLQSEILGFIVKYNDTLTNPSEALANKLKKATDFILQNDSQGIFDELKIGTYDILNQMMSENITNSNKYQALLSQATQNISKETEQMQKALNKNEIKELESANLKENETLLNSNEPSANSQTLPSSQNEAKSEASFKNEPQTLPDEAFSLKDSNAKTLNGTSEEKIAQSLAHLQNTQTAMPAKITQEDFEAQTHSFNNVKNFIKHLESREDANARKAYLNLIEPTLKDWNLRISREGKNNLVKSFVYDVNGAKKIFSVVATNQNGKILFTFLPTKKQSYIKTLIKNAESVEIRQGAIKVSRPPLENKP